MSETSDQATSLWMPGQHLDDEYPTPTDEELCDLWQNYTGTESYPLTNIYGVFSKPDEVRAVASIDLCEIVRETSISMHLSLGQEGPDRGYSIGRWFSAEIAGEEIESSVVTNVIRVLLANNHIQPVAGIGRIRSILLNWRTQGVYTVANTSTLPGCERSTIGHTLGSNLPRCFDALLLPRNHDGKGKLTKAGALLVLAAEAGLPLHDIPLVHIDDTWHHIASFQSTFTEHGQSRFLMPYVFVSHPNGELEQPQTPLEAFEAADEHFREQGVIV